MKMIQSFKEEWSGADGIERAYMVGGAFFLAAAVVGVFLPIVPQVPFAILSAFLFSKGSPKIHRWIRKNKHLGQPVKDWEDHRVVRTKLKIFSTVAMLGGGAFGHWKLESPLFWILDGLFLIAIIFLVTRKSQP